MQVLGIVSVDLDVAEQLLSVYSTFVKYLRKEEIQWGPISATYRLQESWWFIYSLLFIFFVYYAWRV